MLTASSEGIKNMPTRIRIGYVVLLFTFLATFFAILFGCFPVQKHWQINPDPGRMPALSAISEKMKKCAC